MMNYKNYKTLAYIICIILYIYIIKDIFGSLCVVVFLDFLYLHILQVNAEFNTLIKTVGYIARYFRKLSTFANNFDFIWIFSYSHLSIP